MKFANITNSLNVFRQISQKSFVCCSFGPRIFTTAMRRLPRARFWFPFLACFLIGLLCYHHYYSNSLNRVKNATPLDPMHALKLKHSKTIKILIDAGTVPQFMSIQKMEELLYEEQDLAHIQKLRLNNLKKYCRKHPDAWAVHKDRRVSTQLMAKRHFEKYGRFYSVLEPYKYYECRVAKAATTARSFVLWAAFHQGWVICLPSLGT